MAYELVENADEIHIHGNCFIESLSTHKHIVVEGDLVCGYVSVPTLTLAHGSLIVQHNDIGKLHADILGVNILGQPFVPERPWSYNYLRPVISWPNPAKWSSEDSIENACQLFEHPAIVATPHDATTALFAKIRARPTCARARVLFSVALETLAEHNAFTPLGLQVARPMIDKGLPPDWRW